MRIVLDTNVFISGVLWAGNESAILQMCSSGTVEVYLSPRLLQEYCDVLCRRKFANRLASVGVEPDDVLASLLGFAHVVDPNTTVDIITEDPDDNMVLECAEAVPALDFIVSGDAHLLKLKSYKGIPIVQASEFLKYVMP
jgi:putative PIN family toxin of toxin-antitoxin system